VDPARAVVGPAPPGSARTCVPACSARPPSCSGRGAAHAAADGSAPARALPCSQGFYIARDPHAKKILWVIRGASDINEVLADLAGNATPLPGGGYGHWVGSPDPITLSR
jgi:hypothetical protein